MLVEEIRKVEGAFILLSGGNVTPRNTPYNEALEMKKYLIEAHKIPEHWIAIDPFAENTVTNLRNAGRFMLSHGVKEATIITTFVQRKYVGHPNLSSFHWRSRRMLGYRVGELEAKSELGVSFKPTENVFQIGPSSLDP